MTEEHFKDLKRVDRISDLTYTYTIGMGETVSWADSQENSSKL